MSMYSKRNVWCAIVLYFALVQAVVGQTRYCTDDVEYCFTITLPPPESNETLVHFRLEAPSTAGWVGLSIGGGMTNGYLIVAWPNDNGSITLSQREGEEGFQPTLTNQQDDLTLLSSSSVNKDNKLIVEFTRPLNVKGNTIKIKQTFGYAFSTLNPYDDSKDAYLPRHDYNGNIDLNLKEGGSELARYDKLVIAHASLMFAAWLFIIPIAIFIARFGKNFFPTTWFKLHVGIQVSLSTPVILAGSSLSFVAAGSNLKFDDPHQIVGFALFLGFFVQLAIGAIHHHLYDPNRSHIPWWTQLHWWFGRALVVLATFQIPLGLKLYGAKMSYFYIYYVYLFILLIAFSFSSFRLWSKSRGQDGGFKRMPDSARVVME